MIFVHDTRDKPGKHKNLETYLKQCGHKAVRSKMYVGDVSLLHNQSVCIDLKQGLNEVESNLIHDHERFKGECIRAAESGIKLIVLIEEAGIASVKDIADWKNPRRENWEKIKRAHARGQMMNRVIASKPPVDGKTLCRIMQTMATKYGVEWAFCKKSETGARVCELLGAWTGEALDSL